MSKVVHGKTRASTGSSRISRQVTYGILIFEGKMVKIEDGAPLHILLQKSIYIPRGLAGSPILFFRGPAEPSYLERVLPSCPLFCNFSLWSLLLHAGSWQSPPSSFLDCRSVMPFVAWSGVYLYWKFAGSMEWISMKCLWKIWLSFDLSIIWKIDLVFGVQKSMGQWQSGTGHSVPAASSGHVCSHNKTVLLDICEDKRVFGLGHWTVVLMRDPIGGPAGCSAVSC